MSDKTYLVPKPDVAWEEIEGVLEELGAEEVPAEEGVLQSWKVGDTLVHLYEDPELDIEELVLEGSAQQGVAKQLRERVPTYTPDDMSELFAEILDEDDFAHKLGILAAVAPPKADAGLVGLFRRGFNHEDSIVRERAALVATLPAWPELRSDVERLAEEDSDEDVRETASIALKDFRRKK